MSKPAWKVIYGPVEQFDETLNAVTEDYEPHTWQLAVGDERVGFCMVLISKAELQRRTVQAMANAVPQGAVLVPRGRG